MPTPIERFSQALSQHAGEFAIQLRAADLARLKAYYELLIKWNPRLHLVAPCAPEEFATRHVLESLFLLRHISLGAHVVDLGSGAGLPIIPCLIVRDDLQATLIESSQKKSIFLRQALNATTNSQQAGVVLARFEDTVSPRADFITCRAIDRFERILPRLIDWAPVSSTLLIFAGPALRQQIEGLIPNVLAELVPGSEQRFLIRVSGRS
jgi:16S rRNA (guanine527-N7)-methyltransferase